jgi:cytochrome c oxidase cbb3-type subunit 1
MTLQQVTNRVDYNDDIIKLFTLAALFWVVIGLSAGVYIALEMAFPILNFDLPWLSFGRLRPVHTSGVVFAFGGNVLFASSLYVVQRTCQARLQASNSLLKFIFVGYQTFLVLALTGYLFGYTQAKEYAEPEWYADLLLTAVWVAYLWVYVATILKRQEPHIYVANWFFLAFILVIAMLHLGNNISIPLSLFSPHSVSAFSGVQSAMIQWWYGHNVIGFFLTSGFIGIMYYFIPKRANRPVYSYRLSIMHFWALIFLYIWAGSHHLHYSALPDWTQTLGMTMSLILWIPSWGGMVNGIMTLSGAWGKLRDDPVLRFLVIAVAFYGMSTFEGPLMAIKSVNALSHYTEWTISHVHSGALGWVALISFGALYHMVPRLWGHEEMYSVRLISIQMWRSYDEMGFLKYSFIEVVKQLHPLYITRAVGGGFFLSGALVMVYNAYKTIKMPVTNSIKGNQ